MAEFFSFGTNDLTQTTMGLSRDDAGRFLPDYVDEKKAGVFKADPFQSLDIKGVGMLMRWGIEKGRKTRPKLKIGICGEHGGDAESVKFCHRLGWTTSALRRSACRSHAWRRRKRWWKRRLATERKPRRLLDNSRRFSLQVKVALSARRHFFDAPIFLER